jgi:hypothetical protein
VPACGGSMRIETIHLDRAARAYEAHLGSLRLLRAAVGYLAVMAAIPPLVSAVSVPLLYFYPPSEEWRMPWGRIVTVGIGGFGLFLAGAYLYFWALRALAAGSLRAARVVLVAVSVITALNVAYFVWYDFDFATAATQPNRSGDWSRRLVLAVLVAAQLTCLFLLYLMLTGPARILRTRESPLFPLFLNHNYQREFWPGGTVLLRNLWTLLGIPTPLNHKKVHARRHCSTGCVLSRGIGPQLALGLSGQDR